jgi:hypothetical protein
MQSSSSKIEKFSSWRADDNDLFYDSVLKAAALKYAKIEESSGI